jgi:glucose/arabinose dehydrogenase
MSRSAVTAPARRRLATAVAVASAALLTTALVAGPVVAHSARQPDATTRPVPAAPSASTVALVKVADVANPVLAVSPPGDDRLFIVLQGGRIKLYKDNELLGTDFLDIHTLVSKGGEQGLLGLAFHPDFAENRRFFVNFTNRDGDTVIREYRASSSNPDRAATDTAKNILKIHQPYSNHNGGMIAFGPDGYLYIGMGDGGDAGDPGNRAQDKDKLLGKMLRIDVDRTAGGKRYRSPSTNPYVGKPGANEVWQRGLRNPWRFSFDRATGDLLIGDVGQYRLEEIDLARRTSSGPGRGKNFGWRVMEGTRCYRPASGCDKSGKTLPIAEFGHGGGRCAVTGGYVYRGNDIPDLVGWYIYGDYCSGEVWALDPTQPRPIDPVRIMVASSGRLVSGFGEDATGELYLCDQASDAVYAIVPQK